ncbi:unnamed protein product [Ixodes persulcatus]
MDMHDASSRFNPFSLPIYTDEMPAGGIMVLAGEFNCFYSRCHNFHETTTDLPPKLRSYAPCEHPPCHSIAEPMPQRRIAKARPFRRLTRNLWTSVTNFSRV